MANYCFNSLDIIGKAEDIKRLEEFIKNKKEDDDGGEKWSLDNIIPVGIDENGCYKVTDIYAVWGTKWIADINFNNNGCFADMSFDTAWNPSLPITLEMSKKFNLKINHFYEESGNDFEGNCEVDNGVVISDSHSCYRPRCMGCGEKFDRDKMTYDDDEGEHYCMACGDELTGIVMEKIEKINGNRNKEN